MSKWPDTTNEPPPTYHCYASALWLLGRHPQLAELADRVPGLARRDPDGTWFLDLERLAEAFRAHYQGWLTTSDAIEARMRELGRMSRTERTRLRLLAFFAAERVPISANDLNGLDADGQRLLADWCTAIQAT
jgi:hypothetical protein